MKIGMIVAVASEIKQLFNQHGSELKEIHQNGYSIFHAELKGHDVYIAQSGAGEIGASAVAQLLITAFEVELIVNYGVVGSLITGLDLAETVVVKDIIHYDYDTSEIDHVEIGRYLEFDSCYVPTTKKYLDLALATCPSLKAVRCASGDKFVGNPEVKKELNKLYTAQICDMESAGIVLTTRRNSVDCLLIKAVSDSVHGGAEEFNHMVERSAKLCMDVLLEILENIA